NSKQYFCHNGRSSLTGVACTSLPSPLIGSTAESIDEQGKRWLRYSDGLGRLAGVLEPDPQSGTPSLLTTYSYNTLNDLTFVSQVGASGEVARTRSFVYDSLSRLISATNPETGLISYAYTASGGLCAGDVTLPCSKTDARGVSF